MSIFSPQEQTFLARHGFSEEDVYDGRGQGKRWREYKAKEAGKILILTSSPCRAEGHFIRTRAGHCAQCKPANIGFTARESASGYVYIAGSLLGRVIKIGVAGDMGQRARQLNSERYGGHGDWSVLIHVWVDDCGKIERTISDRIKGERVYATYWKDGLEQTAKEMIQCSFSTAFKAYTEIVGSIVNEQRYLAQWHEYEFSS
ncbi:GIY-YIG nuclease family protein [Bradyrhizobium sp. WSM471]|uniref:GIY-YIG nuclease family protein n=1 Tax=Bradyrhizobium sp. WSM471 TaxID=319017 RepID=UPI00024D2018|nr:MULTISPECIES: GIY-YIG nuclease family protein [Bradyrhizobium]EHR01237.1 T5orf172 domain-containing protein [Bradyrhizobium sp. WSM471]UFW43301.1 GIY-YIG nuclease family protein [Bradyrhizobium canariense]